MIELNGDRVMELARNVVERMGEDHVSPLYFTRDCVDNVSDDVDVQRESITSTCRYVTPQGEAGCIVGQILHEAGVPLDALSEFEGVGAEMMIYRVNDGAIDATPRARDILLTLQAAQDEGVPWGWLVDNCSHRLDSQDLINMWRNLND